VILRRASVRYLARHPWQFGLAVLGVAVGIAMVVSIDLANESARRAFISTAQTLSGKATHQIIGGSRGLPEETYRTLRVDMGIDRATPVVEGYVVAPDFNRTFHMMGIDPFSAASFHGYFSGTSIGHGTRRLITEPGTFLMTAVNAEKMDIQIGDTLEIEFGGVRHGLILAGLIEVPNAFNQQALATVLFTDIATAQELIGIPHYISRIDLMISNDKQGRALLESIHDRLPPGAVIIGADTRTHTLQQMTLAFQTNLTGLSLLALVVGMFLIYNTITFSVIQRRNYIGILRALGVSRREVFTMVLREALIITCLGTVAGLVLGVVLGQGFLHLVTRTINDLYFLINVSGLTVTWGSIVKSVILGVGVTLIAALVPAIEATRTPPAAVMQRSMLEAHRRRIILPVTLTGIAIIGLGSGLLLMPSVNLALSYTAMFTLIAGFVLLAPLAVVVLMRLFQPLFGSLLGILGKLAARDLLVALSRTTIAVAALAVAIAVTIGVGIMIVSFRDAVENWLDQYLRADIYVTVPGANHTTTTPAISPELIDRLSSLQGVASISTGRRIDVMTAGNMTEVHVIDMNADNFKAYRFKSGDAVDIWPLFREGGVIISEPYAFHHHISTGDAVTLRTDHGVRSFPVVGIFYDYGSDQGIVTMDRPVYERNWDDRRITSLGLYVKQGVDVGTLIEVINQTIEKRQSILVRSNKTLRAASLEIFDRTFAITTVLRMLAIVVAFIGILSALMALQLENAYEYAVLRANGLTPRQVWGLTSLQTGLMGFSAGILALPLGIILTLVLIYVINQRSFGWSMQVSLEPAILIEAVVLAVIAALLAGLYPAYRMARVIPLHALRAE
jgi:putative ABC transport system permease protein